MSPGRSGLQSRLVVIGNEWLALAIYLSIYLSRYVYVHVYVNVYVYVCTYIYIVSIYIYT